METDAQVQQGVMPGLDWCASEDAARIGVEVNKEIVALAGPVANVAEEMEVARAAPRVSEAVVLTIAVAVQIPAVRQGREMDIACSMGVDLKLPNKVPKNSVKVRVEGGKITLSGQVGAAHQSEAAEKAIYQLMGAVGVINDIEVATKLTSASVLENITAEVKRHARTGTRKVLVEVCGSVVILTGTVSSWSEHDRVAHSVWNDPQVQCVVDNMIVDQSM